MEHIFRIFDFNVYNTISDNDDDSDSVSSEEYHQKKVDKNEFTIQIFGINEKRETFSVIVEQFKPFFYVKVGDKWNLKMKEEMKNLIKLLENIEFMLKNLMRDITYKLKSFWKWLTK